MISILRGHRMASEQGVSRFFVPGLLELVALVCLFEAGDSVRAHDYKPAVAWFILGVAFSVVGFAWPTIKENWRLFRAAKKAADEMTLDDPRIYLEIEAASEGFFPRTPFILRNEGKYEAHHVAIQPFKLCRKVVTFPEVAVISVGKPEKALPTVEDGGAQNVTHDIFHWLNKDWDSSGTLADEDWPIPITITYCDPLGKRRFEGTVTLVFHPWTHNMNKKHPNAPNFILRHRDPGYEFINPQFRLL